MPDMTHAPTTPPPQDHRTPPRLSKWALMGVYWIVQSAIVLPLILLWGWQAGTVDGRAGRPWGDPAELVDVLLGAMKSPRFWLFYLGVCATLAVLQTLLLLPVARPRARAARGVPLGLSAACAGLIVTALLAGLVFSVLQVLAHYASPWLLPIESLSSDTVYAALGFAALVSWCISTPLVFAFCVRRLNAGTSWERTLQALASRLFLGTVVEMLAVIPLDVMVRRKTDCYCFAGTFIGLTLGLVAGLVVLGPVVLLPLIIRRRRRWQAGHCDACGYDISGLLAASRSIDRCPECGAGWRASPGVTISGPRSAS